MARLAEWVRNFLAVSGLIAMGFWLGNSRMVVAANNSGGDVEFQLSGVSETGSLMVYQPTTKTVYVYQGAMTGSSNIHCSFKFQLGSPGGAIHRENCPIGSANY